jgi:hypothetical protein
VLACIRQPRGDVSTARAQRGGTAARISSSSMATGTCCHPPPPRIAAAAAAPVATAPSLCACSSAAGGRSSARLHTCRAAHVGFLSVAPISRLGIFPSRPQTDDVSPPPDQIGFVDAHACLALSASRIAKWVPAPLAPSVLPYTPGLPAAARFQVAWTKDPQRRAFSRAPDLLNP